MVGKMTKIFLEFLSNPVMNFFKILITYCEMSLLDFTILSKFLIDIKIMIVNIYLNY